MSQCWICGAKANSGEHKVKKSDLKRHMPLVGQKTPIYHRSNGRKKKSLGSVDSGAIKFNKSICSLCNGALTQKHDLAWDELSEYLFSTALHRKANVKLNDIFTNDIYDSIRSVHLYFAKLFGCKVVESNINLDISDVADSIKNDILCNSLYIRVRHSDNGKSKGYCAISDVSHFEATNKNVEIYSFFYTVGEYTVDVLYSDNLEGFDMEGYFQPMRGQDNLDICEVTCSSNSIGYCDLP